MKVSLIGGAGFIGHNLACMLTQKGHEVQVIDNLMWNNITANVIDGIDDFRRDLYHRFLMQRFSLMRFYDVRMVNADARVVMDLYGALDAFQPETIVHMSAISSALRARENPGLCFDLQLTTLKNVLEYAKENRNRVVLMSSSTVYGDFGTDTVDENTRPRPKGIYANAKYMAERLVRTYNDQYGIDTVIVRPSALYGERCISGRVSQKFIELALQGKPLPLDGGGQGKLDFTYINDLADGIARTIECSGRNTFNVTFGKARSIRELAEIVRSVIPCEFEETPPNPLAPERGTLSVERARSVLGFEPKWSLETGYRAYVEWYVSQWNACKTDRRRPDFEPGYSHADQAVPA